MTNNSSCILSINTSFIETIPDLVDILPNDTATITASINCRTVPATGNQGITIAFRDNTTTDPSYDGSIRNKNVFNNCSINLFAIPSSLHLAK